MVDYLKDNKDIFPDLSAPLPVEKVIKKATPTIKSESNNSTEIQLSDIDISTYRDEDGLTAGKLNLSYWVLWGRSFSGKLATFFVLLLIFALVIYFAFALVSYLIFGFSEEGAMVDKLTMKNFSKHSQRSEMAARDIVIGRIYSLSSSDDNSKYDLYTEISNPNEGYSAIFDYYFVTDSVKTKIKQDFVLPGDKKILMNLGLKMEVAPIDANLKIENISWRKINRHEIGDWVKYQNDHLSGILITDTEVTVSKNNSGQLQGAKEAINLLKFKVKNNTPFGYSNVGFNILLRDGYDSVVRVERYYLGDFPVGAERNASLNITGHLANIKRTEILPDIDILTLK